MTRFGLFISLAAALACTGDKGTDTAGSVDSGTTTGDQGCGVEIDDTYPVLEATDMYYMSNIEVELSDPDETATLTLQDSAGADVPGTLTVDDDTLTFDPTDPLQASSSYTAVLTYCGSETPVEIGFMTSSLGGELEGGDSSVLGQTYALDISSGKFVEPPGVGDLLGGLIEFNILIGIRSVENGELGIRGAISDEGSTSQDYCTSTLDDFPPADFSNAPYFEIPEGDFNISLAGMEATIKDLSVTGTFAADGSYFGGGTLSGALDARELLPLLGDAGLEAETPDDVCNLLLGFGVQCVPCSDGEEYCVNLVVERLTAEATGETLGLVCEGECHASCASNSDECTEPQAPELEECPAE